MMMKKYCLLMVFLAACWITAYAQEATNGYFVTRLGRDTIAVEQYEVNGHELKGMSVVRSPRTVIRQYEASFGATGELNEFHVTLRSIEGAVSGERDYLYEGDSVKVTFKQDTVTRKFGVLAKGRPIPLFVDIVGGWDIALQRALRTGGTRAFEALAGKEILHYKVTGGVPGTVVLVNPEKDFGPLHATVDREGNLQKFDMTETTDKFIIERVRNLDVDALAKSFAAREEAGKALGVLSPRDTVKAEIAGAHLLIDYGRPAVRGRKIFGGAVVPWGVVWRTGANAATQLVTDKELLFGNVVVPPGTYSLFTLPSEHGWKLIVNRQHGQWGTVYDDAKDLARLPLTVKHQPSLTERFTFTIDAKGNGGAISFRWAETEASIPFVVKE